VREQKKHYTYRVAQKSNPPYGIITASKIFTSNMSTTEARETEYNRL